MAKRGIDGNDMEQQVQDIENRGKELLKEYKDKKASQDSCEEKISASEADAILEPLKGAFQLMANAINLSGNIWYDQLNLTIHKVMSF